MSYSNAVALRMPSNYVPMSNEEMEYLEGGQYVETMTTLKKARTYFSTMMAANAAGVLTQTIATAISPIFVVTAAYFTCVLAQATSCYNWVSRQMSKYTSSKTCTISTTAFAGCVTDLEVGW